MENEVRIWYNKFKKMYYFEFVDGKDFYDCFEKIKVKLGNVKCVKG